MKVFMYGDTIVNLAEVTHINTITISSKTEIFFYFKTGKDTVIKCPKNEVTKILQICYEEMTKKEE